MTDAALTPLPEAFSCEAEIEACMRRPYPEVVDLMRRLPGDLAILGVAGKMGLALGAVAVAASRAAGVARRVYGVSRFSAPDTFAAVARAGMTPLQCDLTDFDQMETLKCNLKNLKLHF